MSFLSRISDYEGTVSKVKEQDYYDSVIDPQERRLKYAKIISEQPGALLSGKLDSLKKLKDQMPIFYKMIRDTLTNAGGDGARRNFVFNNTANRFNAIQVPSLSVREAEQVARDVTSAWIADYDAVLGLIYPLEVTTEGIAENRFRTQRAQVNQMADYETGLKQLETSVPKSVRKSRKSKK